MEKLVSLYCMLFCLVTEPIYDVKWELIVHPRITLWEKLIYMLWMQLGKSMKYNDYYLYGVGEKGCKQNMVGSNAEPHKHCFLILNNWDRKKGVHIKFSCSQVIFLPIMIVRGQDHTWTRIGIACDPGTVDCKHHQ